ncbi:MAG TPA: hypothetical protein VKR99_08790 [Candidatus Eremiobacteraceae bacterium]|nr:hypothetical protein [Candidatus Eremiobacteraceae bacterium]
MVLLAIVAAGIVLAPAALSATAATQPAATALAPQSHHIGETFDYSLHGEMSQSIMGQDAFGRRLNQVLAPTSVKGHESIAITALSASLVSLERSGSVTATVDGATPHTQPGSGFTTVDNRGAVLRDKGKLGGLFLLPVVFLGDQAMNQGNALQIGDRWAGQLGTKLYGMLSRPMLHFSVVGERTVLGVNVYSVIADGDVKMKEPVMTSTGEALGYATGVAHVTVHADYDRDNRRLVSMDIELTDTLHYAVSKHIRGSVHDHQRYLVALDASSMVTGQHNAMGSDPAADPPAESQSTPKL